MPQPQQQTTAFPNNISFWPTSAHRCRPRRKASKPSMPAMPEMEGGALKEGGEVKVWDRVSAENDQRG